MRRPLPVHTLLTIMLAVCLSVPGCVSTPAAPTDPEEAKAEMLLAVAMLGTTGRSLRDEMMHANADATLASARTLRAPEEAINEIEHIFREEIDQVIFDTIIPIYTEHFSARQLDEMITFLQTPAGKKFCQLTRDGLMQVETILDKAGPDRAAMQTFLLTPTGQNLVSQSPALAKELEEKTNTAFIRQRVALVNRVNLIRSQYKF